MPNQWSKWWWLRVSSIPHWSSDERRAAATFCVTCLVACLFLSVVFAGCISPLRFSFDLTLSVSFGIALLATVPNLRGLTTALFPNTIQKGDQAAADRVGGEVFLPDEKIKPTLWWCDYHPGASHNISWEEQHIKIAIFLIAILIFFPCILYLPRYLMERFGLTQSSSLVAIILAILPLSLIVARKLSIRIWPDIARRAEENAVARCNPPKPKVRR
ncbi:hypothetical protein ACQR1W_34240 [Bradyrhizobium sp. HKCCYLS1011]|uniref:hypothetical protein n=1 Tax=Bradyrhizobium sp. HKCCYLS1011 TaxID=3420733 RepID=UPI003EC1216E